MNVSKTKKQQGMSRQNFFINELRFRKFFKRNKQKIYSHHTKGDTIFIIIMHTVTPINIYFFCRRETEENKRNLNIEKRMKKNDIRPEFQCVVAPY